jgi:hypothetical protein
MEGQARGRGHRRGSCVTCADGPKHPVSAAGGGASGSELVMPRYPEGIAAVGAVGAPGAACCRCRRLRRRAFGRLAPGLPTLRPWRGGSSAHACTSLGVSPTVTFPLQDRSGPRCSRKSPSRSRARWSPLARQGVLTDAVRPGEGGGRWASTGWSGREWPDPVARSVRLRESRWTARYRGRRLTAIGQRADRRTLLGVGAEAGGKKGSRHARQRGRADHPTRSARRSG